MTKTNDNAFITVVIPARNEEASIGKVIDDVPSSCVQFIVVCDNGSKDQTAVIAERHGAHVIHEQRAGYGAACIAALTIIPDETDIVVFLDADYSDDPRQLTTLVQPILDGKADFVLGSRVENAERGALTPQQRFGNWLSTKLIRALHGHKFNDLGPFRAIKRTALEQMKMRDRGMGWTVEMQLKAVRMGLEIAEIPVSYRPRIGKSKISGTLVGSVRAGAKIISLILRDAWSDAPRNEIRTRL